MDKIKSCWKKIPIPVAFMLCSITAILLALLFTNITMRFAQSGQAMIQEKYVEIDLDDLKPANDSEGLVEAVPGEDTEKFQLIQLPPSAFSEEDQQKYSFYYRCHFIFVFSFPQRYTFIDTLLHRLNY